MSPTPDLRNRNDSESSHNSSDPVAIEASTPVPTPPISTPPVLTLATIDSPVSTLPASPDTAKSGLEEFDYDDPIDGQQGIHRLNVVHHCQGRWLRFW